MPVPKIGVWSGEARCDGDDESKGLGLGEAQFSFNQPYTELRPARPGVYRSRGHLRTWQPDYLLPRAGATSCRHEHQKQTYQRYLGKTRHRRRRRMDAVAPPACTGRRDQVRASVADSADGSEWAPATPARAVDPRSRTLRHWGAGQRKPRVALLKLDALDTETTLRLFGTLTARMMRDEWSLALEQEVGFDLDCWRSRRLVRQKRRPLRGRDQRQAQGGLSLQRATNDPVRFELSLSPAGNTTTFSDVACGR